MIFNLFPPSRGRGYNYEALNTVENWQLGYEADEGLLSDNNNPG